MAQPLAIGVDAGGTKLAFALVNESGDVLATHQLPTLAAEGAEGVMDRMAEGIHTLLDQADGQVIGIGIGCPGSIDTQAGIVINAVNMHFDHVHLVAGVRDRLTDELPIWLQKDTNAALLGELVYGVAKGVQDFVLIAVGTGLGGGALVNGDVVVGANHNPTEIGHLSLNPDGRLCNCGLRGCPEIYLAGMGMAAGVREHRADFPQSALAQKDSPITAQILAAAREGDPLGLLILREAGVALGAVIANMCGILNPAMVVIGGGLGHAIFDEALPFAVEELKRRTLPPTWQRLKIVRSEVTDSALGAAALVWHGLSAQNRG